MPVVDQDLRPSDLREMERRQRLLGRLSSLPESAQVHLDPAIERRSLEVSSLWESGIEPMAFDRFCETLDGCPLFPYQADVLRKAGVIRAWDIINPGRELRELILLWGKGSGKDYLSAKLIAYGAYTLLNMAGDPAPYFGLAPHTTLHIVNCAPNKEQALDPFFKYLRGFIGTPLFQQWHDSGECQIRSEKVLFITRDKDIALLSQNSRAQSNEGKNLVMAVMDEADAFFDAEGKSNAEAVHNVYRSSAVTRMTRVPPLIIVITYQRTGDGFAERLKERTKKAIARGDKQYFLDVAPTRVVNPRFNPNDPIVVEDFANDPALASAMYDCNPMATEGAFFEFTEKIDAAIDPRLLPVAQYETPEITHYKDTGEAVHYVGMDVFDIRPVPGHNYFMGVDGGESGDSFAIAVFYTDTQELAASWLCPRCGGDPDCGASLRSVSRYEEMPWSIRASQYPDAVCGICAAEGVRWSYAGTLSGWWRNVGGKGTVTIKDQVIPKITEALLIEVRPTRANLQGQINRTVHFPTVRKEIIRVGQALGVRKIRFDRYQTTDMKQAIISETGIDADEISMANPAQHLRARVVKSLVNHDGVALIGGEGDPYERRNREWKRLQRQGKGNTVRIDHPVGGSKDLWDAEAIAIEQAALAAVEDVRTLL